MNITPDRRGGRAGVGMADASRGRHRESAGDRRWIETKLRGPSIAASGGRSIQPGSDDVDPATGATTAVDDLSSGLGLHAGAEPEGTDALDLADSAGVMHGEPRREAGDRGRRSPGPWAAFRGHVHCRVAECIASPGEVPARPPWGVREPVLGRRPPRLAFPGPGERTAGGRSGADLTIPSIGGDGPVDILGLAGASKVDPSGAPSPPSGLSHRSSPRIPALRGSTRAPHGRSENSIGSITGAPSP